MRFLPHHAALIAGFSRANDAIVPVICPTCQMVRKCARQDAGSSRLLCMGLFSIFGWVGLWARQAYHWIGDPSVEVSTGGSEIQSLADADRASHFPHVSLRNS